MLKKKAIRKILITSMTLIILSMVYIMPGEKTGMETLKVNKQIEYKDEKLGYIYLLNDQVYIE